VPKDRIRAHAGVRTGNLAVALAAGAMMTLFVLASSTADLPADAARFYLESSYPLAHGRNVVNVILVDFRAVDTLGEISVVAAAAFGVFAMLTIRPKKREDDA
jgi:multicomponent Na+:H+ antiporter subunit A